MSIINWFMHRLVKMRLTDTGEALTQSELVRSLLFLLLLILTGTLTYSATEGWSLLNALYATVITITTVGYGDLTPQSATGRLFAIGFTLLAVSLGGYAFTSLSAYAIQKRERVVAARYRRKRMNRINALQKHYILCGADWLGTRIAEDFNLAGVAFVVIDIDPDRLKKTLLHTWPGYFEQKIKCLMHYEAVDLEAYEALTLDEVSEKVGIPYLLGNPVDVMLLLQAGIERASGLITTWEDDRDNLSIVIGARNLARMASHMLHPEIGNWWYSRSSSNKKKQGLLEQVDILDESEWFGLTIADVHARHRVVTLSVKREGVFVSPPPHDWVLQAGDIAIVLAGAG